MHVCIHLFIRERTLKGLYGQDTMVDAVNIRVTVSNMKWNLTRGSNMWNKQQHSCSGWDRNVISFGFGCGESNLWNSQGEMNCFLSIKIFSYIFITYIYNFHYRLCVCKFTYWLKLVCNHNVNTCVLQSFGDIVACPVARTCTE